MDEPRNRPIAIGGTHVPEQMTARGATREEIEATIRTAPWEPAKHGRIAATRWFPDASRPPFTGKDVRPIFVVGAASLTVITVYVYWNRRSTEEESR
jgi:hypothetical protein